MKFNCENCGTRYTLSDEKVKNRILKIRCKVCEEVIIVRDPARARSRPPALAPAPPPEIEWYVSRGGGAPQGPMPLERLEDQVRAGALKPSDMVWNQDMDEWATAEVTLAAQFDAARETVPRPALPSPAALRGLPRAPGRVKEPAPLLPRPRSGVRTPAPLAAKPALPKPAQAPALPPSKPVKAPVLPAPRSSQAPALPASKPVKAPVLPAPRSSQAPALPPVDAAPTPPVNDVEAPATDDALDEPTQAMASDLGALLASLSGADDAEPDAAIEATNDTVALPATGAQVDTLFAPAATASAAASMQTNDTTLLPGIDADAPAADAQRAGDAEAPDASAPDASAPAVDVRLSDAAPALPSSAPPAVAAAPDEDADDAAPVAPVQVVAPPAAITMTGEQVAFAEGAFFGTDERPAAAAVSGDAFIDAMPRGSMPVDDDRRSKLPLLIVLGVLLLGGGIALGVMLARDDGGAAPATTASAASEAPKTEAPATEAPATEAPASLAAVTDAPASEAPASAVSEAPPSEAPASEASVASAAPATKAPTRRPASTVSRAKPKTVKSAAPVTKPSRFASLNGNKPEEVSPAALKTEAVVELPETLSPSKISSIIRRYKKGLHGCYQRQLKRDASMRKANLKLAFTIERSGRTSNIKVDRKYDGTELKTCLNRLVRRWRFPQFTGESIPVEYPLFFQASL